MAAEEFYKQLTSYIKANRKIEANMLLMKELGRIILSKKDDFIYVLKYAGVDVPDNASDLELIDLFIDNINGNKKLLLGTSFLISHSNKMSGFDGDEYTSNICADAIHKSMNSYFCGSSASGHDGFVDGETMSSFEGDGDNLAYSNGEGDLGAIAGGIGSLADLGSKFVQNRGKKLDARNAPLTALVQKNKAKNALIQSVVDIKKEQAKSLSAKQAAEAKAKRTKLIVIGSIAGIGLIVIGIIAYKKLNK